MQNDEENLHQSMKPGVFGGELAEILCRAFDEAKAVGVGRKMIARKLRIDSRLIDLWCAPSRSNAITSAMLVQLIAQEDALPPKARRRLMSDLAELANMQVVSEADPDSKPLVTQLAEILAALGGVADEIKVAEAPSSEMGRGVSATEKKQILDGLDEVIREASAMRRRVMQLKGVR